MHHASRIFFASVALDDLAKIERAFVNGRLIVVAGQIQSVPHTPEPAPQIEQKKWAKSRYGFVSHPVHARGRGEWRLKGRTLEQAFNLCSFRDVVLLGGAMALDMLDARGRLVGLFR